MKKKVREKKTDGWRTAQARMWVYLENESARIRPNTAHARQWKTHHGRLRPKVGGLHPQSPFCGIPRPDRRRTESGRNASPFSQAPTYERPFPVTSDARPERGTPDRILRVAVLRQAYLRISGGGVFFAVLPRATYPKTLKKNPKRG